MEIKQRPAVGRAELGTKAVEVVATPPNLALNRNEELHKLPKSPSQKMASPSIARLGSLERGVSLSRSRLNLGHLATSPTSESLSPSIPDGKGSLVALSKFSLLPTQQRHPEESSVEPSPAVSAAQRIREHRTNITADVRPKLSSPCSILSFKSSDIDDQASSHFKREMILPS